jgi:hypothetical protein
MSEMAMEASRVVFDFARHSREMMNGRKNGQKGKTAGSPGCMSQQLCYHRISLPHAYG